MGIIPEYIGRVMVQPYRKEKSKSKEQEYER
jgi:hypothetical protein